MLTTKTIRFLNKNGYGFTQSKNVISFSRPWNPTWLIILAGFIGAIVLMLNIRNLWIGGGICLVIAVAVDLIIRLTKRKPYFLIDTSKRRILLKKGSKSIHEAFKSLQELSIGSSYEGSFTSASKQTSDDYEIRIDMKLGNETYTLFKFESDYREPGLEINEVYGLLKESMGNPSPIETH